MIRDASEILKHGYHEFLLFVPGLAFGGLFLWLGRFYQRRSEGGTTFPTKDPAKSRQAAKFWKGLGIITSGALAVDVWWNFGIIPAVVVTSVFLAEIWVVLRWRNAAPPRNN